MSILGSVVAGDVRALSFLVHQSWSVNEALAIACDGWCAATGYPEAVIREWLRAPSLSPNSHS